MEPTTAVEFGTQALSRGGLYAIVVILALAGAWLLLQLLRSKDEIATLHRDHGSMLASLQESHGKAVAALQQAHGEAVASMLRDGNEVSERILEAMTEIRAAIRATTGRGSGG